MLENLALSENGFLFDARTGSTFSLNKTATYLLRQLIDGTDPDNLTDLLVESFDVEEELAQRDVAQFLFRLKDLGVFGAEEFDQ